MFTAQLLLTILSVVSAASAAPAVQAIRDDDIWFQPRDSPVSALFQKRAPDPSDPNFASNYPSASTTPPTTSLPASWTAKLASIQLPSFGPSTNNNGYPTYANGESGADSTICSYTYACNATDDIQQPPNGVIALSFDDGPTGSSPTLYSFLATNNISTHATHFMIGGNILGNPTEMQAAVSAGGHIAVHTWSHPYMTTLTNEQILGELGWTMQIISDLNGGRLPAFWRPPYGDVDNRVRAIAKGVFGLSTVTWNEDSADWAIGTPNSAYTTSNVEATMTDWLSTPSKIGLCMLEHELNDNTVGVFMTMYPTMQKLGWNVLNVAEAFSMNWYQNAASGNTGSVVPMSVAQVGSLAALSGSSTASSSTISTNATSSTTALSTSSTTAVTTTKSTSISAGAASTAAAAATTKASSAGSSILVPTSLISSFTAIFGLSLSAFLL